MKVLSCTRREYSTILLFLSVFVLILVLRNMDVLEFQPKVNSTIFAPRVSSDPDMSRSFCRFQPLSPQDALEERLILDSTAWHETPLLPALISLEQTSDPAHSTFTILPGRRGGQWHVGDQLEVMIQTSDFQGRPKKSGGDFLLARLHNRKLEAGVAGQVVDLLNGSYSAVFSLLWEGDAHVEDHWLGLMMVSSLTKTKTWTLRVVLWDHDDVTAFAEYRNFRLGSEKAAFKLHVGEYRGDAGDAIRGAYTGIDQNGFGFSTTDRDNDGCNPCIFDDIVQRACTSSDGGGWWYSSCGSAGLNVDWHPNGDHVGWASGLHWQTWKTPAPYSLKATRMMIKSV